MHSIAFLGGVQPSSSKELLILSELIADISNLKVCKYRSDLRFETHDHNTHQGLFDVPTRIIVCVAPINILLNYLLGMF